jgi:hypothetical protein
MAPLPLFLTAWLIAAIALGLALLGLSLVYRLLDSDFGTEGWGREIGLVIFTAGVQALAFLFIVRLTGGSGGAYFRAAELLAFGITFVVYKISHFQEMTEVELAILVATNSAVFLLLDFLAWKWFGIGLSG